MLTLTEFLLARIAEDEAVVAEFIEEWGELSGRISTWQFALVPSHEYAYISTQPERVLAECEAKRRIVELCSGADMPNPLSDYSVGWVTVGCFVLQSLALPYASHPDYSEEWRP